MLTIATPYLASTASSLNSVAFFRHTPCLLLMALLVLPAAQATSLTEASLIDSQNSVKERVSGKVGDTKPGPQNGPQTLLLDVSINTQKLTDIIRVEKLADGRLALPVEAWREARLSLSGEKLMLPDSNPGYALDAVPGLKYKLDIAKLALDITAPAEAFEASAFEHGHGGEIPANQAPPGFYFNYNLLGTQSSDNSSSYGAFLEGVAFNGMGSLVINGVLRGDSDRSELIRTDAYWQKDLPESMETLVMGDTIGTGGA